MNQGRAAGKGLWILAVSASAGYAGVLLLDGLSRITNRASVGVLGASLVGFGMGGEGDVTPYLLSRYFGLRSFSTLYGLTWTAYAIAGAIGPVLMGRAFDATGSYEALLARLALGTLAVAALMLWMPPYRENLRARENLLAPHRN